MFRKLPQNLERLEDRAMLSASYGSMPHGNGGHNVGPHAGDGGGMRFAEPPSFASQPQSRSMHEFQTLEGSRDFGRAPGGFHDQTVIHDAVAPRYELGPTDWGRVGHPTYIQQVFSPPPPQIRAATQQSNPTHSTWNQQVISPPPQIRAVTQPLKPTQGSTSDPYSPVVPPIRAATHRYEPQFIQQIIIIPTTWIPPTNSYQSNVVIDPFINRVVSIRQNTSTRSPAPALIDSTENAIPSAAELLAFSSSVTDLPTVSPIITRDTNSVAVLSTAAHDLAIQDFAPRLPSSASAASYDHSGFSSAGSDAVHAEALDGFIQPYNGLVVEKIVDVADDVAREREAVDAVLRELRDVNTLPSSELPDSQASSADIDLQSEITANEMPAGEVEGGMVLLQSTGDANDSGFDLKNAYAEHAEHFDIETGMETSVGLIQAVDVAVDDTAAADGAEPAGLIVEPQSDVPINESIPAQREQQSSRKAAALVGVTTLTGALLWISRNGGKRDNQLSAAQKRRAHRS